MPAPAPEYVACGGDDHAGTSARGAPATAIRYAVADCPLGRLLLAGTDRGVCALYLGDRDGPLEEALAREFPAAQRRREDAGLGDWLAELLAHLEGRRPHL